MVNCSILSCKNTTNSIGSTGAQKKDISFHTFPKDPSVKEKWIDATGNINWFPTKHSAVCSAHFRESCFIQTKKLRRLKNTAYPTINVLMSTNNCTSHSHGHISHNNHTTIETELHDINDPSTSHGAHESLSTQNKSKILRELSIAYEKIEEQKKKIKCLTEQNRRKDKKIQTLMSVKVSLKKNNLLTDVQTEALIEPKSELETEPDQ